MAVLNDVTFDARETSDESATLWIWCRDDLVVSARHKPLRLVERWQSKLASLGLRSSTELLAQLLAEQEDVLALIVRQSNQYVDPIEDCLLGQHIKSNRASWAACAACCCVFSACWSRNRPRCFA